jgi:hypothetical protein
MLILTRRFKEAFNACLAVYEKPEIQREGEL